MTKRSFGTLAILITGALALTAAKPFDLETSRSPVADAAEARERDTVIELLKEGSDVNAAQGDGMTALHWAALRNDLELTETLLYSGANVGATTRLGAYTPLVLASKTGGADVIRALLDAGADAKTATSTGVTALMFASASGNLESVRLLLEHGARVEAVESSGSETALMFAAAYDRADVIDLLVEHGADPAATTDIIDVPKLNKAIDDGFRQRLDDLAEQRAEAAAAKAEAEGTPIAESAASQAGEEEDDEAAKKEEGGKGFFGKLFGWMTPGKKAEEEQEGRRRRFSRNFGDRVGVQGGMTALLLASRQGHEAAAERLLASGAEVNQVAGGSKTSPLLIASMNGHWDLAMRLLEEGADPNLAAEPSNVTPLYAVLNLAWAPRSSYPQPDAQRQQKVTHYELLRALLEAGAEPNVRLASKVWFMGYNFDRSSIDETGATPFWRAAYGSDVEAMKLLRSYGADPNMPSLNTGERPPVEAQRARELKDISGKPPVEVGEPAMTPLHAATGAGYGEGFAANDHRNHPAGFMPAVKYLVEECGADVNAIDQEGSTPLHNAAARGDVEMIEYLVSKGADVTIINREGRSTADMANGPVQRVQPFPEARDLLVSLGAINHNKCVSC